MSKSERCVSYLMTTSACFDKATASPNPHCYSNLHTNAQQSQISISHNNPTSSTHSNTSPPAMSQDKKPTLVLIPGSFLSSTHYTPLLAHLPPGTKSHILDPPSYHTKRPGAPPTMADDASFVASFVTQLADAGEEVVLVAHSYGGMPASECLRGLSAESRANEGKRGGVRRLGYVTAVVPKEGEGLRETMVGGVQVPLEADEVGFLSSFFFLACTGKFGLGRFWVLIFEARGDKGVCANELLRMAGSSIPTPPPPNLYASIPRLQQPQKRVWLH